MPCEWSFGPYCSWTYINNNVDKRTSNVASVMPKQLNSEIIANYKENSIHVVQPCTMKTLYCHCVLFSTHNNGLAYCIHSHSLAMHCSKSQYDFMWFVKFLHFGLLSKLWFILTVSFVQKALFWRKAKLKAILCSRINFRSQQLSGRQGGGELE